jgi:hypothetical protein
LFKNWLKGIAKKGLVNLWTIWNNGNDITLCILALNNLIKKNHMHHFNGGYDALFERKKTLLLSTGREPFRCWYAPAEVRHYAACLLRK